MKTCQAYMFNTDNDHEIIQSLFLSFLDFILYRKYKNEKKLNSIDKSDRQIYINTYDNNITQKYQTQ